MASSTFFNLPPHLQRRIDTAYLSVCRSLPDFQEPPLKKRKLGDASSEPLFSGGGFLVEEPIEEEQGVDLSNLSNIPLSHVPNGLKLLDLPSDDEQILGVFRQAASGWEADQPRTGASQSSSEQQQTVSFEDWRAVCGVLLEHHDEEYGESSGGDDHEDDAMEGVPREDNMTDSGSDFQGGEESDDASEDDYMEESTSRRRGRNAQSDSHSGDESEGGVVSSKRLTARQKQTCLDTFQLFFSDVTEKELPNKRIMISDVQRVAKLLKEKLKAEDIVEMLSIFSTSADKSMNLSDFEQMMIAAGLA